MARQFLRRVVVAAGLIVGVSGAILVGSGGLFAAESHDGPVANVDVYPTQIVWDVIVPYEQAHLRVAGPGGQVGGNSFSAGAVPVFAAGGNPDGEYTYEIFVTPPLSASAKSLLAEATEADERQLVYESLVASGELPSTTPVQSGAFMIVNGSIEASNSGSFQDGITRDQVIADDLIVTGGLCVGVDCVNGEVFDFVTAKLKENNVRILFEDTSASASFPSNDWQITINDSADGGANKFAIDDVSNARTPFTVEANAPTNSLYVEDSGDVGVGTATPVLELHVGDGDSPGLRLDQTAASGFTPQVWDIAGNESNFFVRDVTNGSTLPFRIQPGAPSNALFIRSGGDVMFGASANPAAQVEVRSDTDQVARFTNSADQTTAVQVSVVQSDPAEPMVEFITPEGVWSIGIDGTTNNMVFRNASARLMSFNRESGAASFAGGVMHASDAARKEAFEEVNPEALLEQALNLRIASWQYKSDRADTRHIGPTAQDFAAAFGLGGDDKYINTVDADGVALGAIQGLNARLMKALEERDARIAELEARLSALEAEK